MEAEDLRPFQRLFLKHALAPNIRRAALSIPRGNGKSALAGYILKRYLTPGDPLFADGAEIVLLAGKLEQARIVFRFVRADLGDNKDYSWKDSSQQIGAIHEPTNTRLRVISSDGRGAMGLVNTRIVVADEPGSWEVNGGELMHDALEGALGKPGSPLRIVYIGTVSPSKGGWWEQMIDGGSRGSLYVQKLQGNREKWSKWSEIKRVNPLTAISQDFKESLLEKRDEALSDSRLKAVFSSYHLNCPDSDESTVLLTVDEWERMVARPVPKPMGKPIVSLDLGHGRSWSAAVAVYRNGVVDALALAPGIPDLATQEKRDRVPAGTYQTLTDGGLLATATGLRNQPPSQLWAMVKERWGQPASVVCDRFRLDDLKDSVMGHVGIEARVQQWSEAARDIRSLQRFTRDGPFTVVEEARPLIAASLAVSLVKHDESGSSRLIKRGSNNESRDDVAAALTLAAGAFNRAEIEASLSKPKMEYAIV